MSPERPFDRLSLVDELLTIIGLLQAASTVMDRDMSIRICGLLGHALELATRLESTMAARSVPVATRSYIDLRAYPLREHVFALNGLEARLGTSEQAEVGGILLIYRRDGTEGPELEKLRSLGKVELAILLALLRVREEASPELILLSAGDIRRRLASKGEGADNPLAVPQEDVIRAAIARLREKFSDLELPGAMVGGRGQHALAPLN